jgi:hypothetical protein
VAVVHRLLQDVFSLLLLRGTAVAVAVVFVVVVVVVVVVALPIHRMTVVTIIIL